MTDWLDDPVRAEMPVGALGEIAREYHDKACNARNDHLTYAVTVGHALSLIRKKSEGRSWLSLAEEWGISRTGAYRYVRVYRNHDQLRPDMTLEEAGAVADPLSRPRATPKMKAEAVRMVIHDGCTQKLAAEVLGVSEATISYWLKDQTQRRSVAQKRRKRQRRAKAAERELQRREHWVLAKDADKPVAKAFGFLRQGAQQLDMAKASEPNPIARRALDEALSEVYKAEELIAQALGLHIESDSNGKVTVR